MHRDPRGQSAGRAKFQNTAMSGKGVWMRQLPNDQSGMSAAIEIPAGAYVVGIWHFEFPPSLSEHGKGDNYLIFLFREENAPPNEWKLIYRFRHYNGNEVWNSKDTFRGYSMTLRCFDEESAREKTDKVVQIAAGIAGNAMVDYTSVRGDGALAFRRLGNLPWFHRSVEVPAP
jgi:hypothetical protein